MIVMYFKFYLSYNTQNYKIISAPIFVLTILQNVQLNHFGAGML